MADNRKPIIKLKPTDLISESMGIINYNFEVISENESIVDYKLSKYAKKIQDELDKLKRNSDIKDDGLSKLLDNLNDKIDDIENATSEDVLQGMIDIAIANANMNVNEFIKKTAKDYIRNSLDGYATTDSLNGLERRINGQLSDYMKWGDYDVPDLSQYVRNTTLEERLVSYITSDRFNSLQEAIEGLRRDFDGLDLGASDLNVETLKVILSDFFVQSGAFTQFKSDALRKFAEASMIAENSKFYKDTDGDLYSYKIVNGSPYEQKLVGIKTIFDYYEYLMNGDDADDVWSDITRGVDLAELNLDGYTLDVFKKRCEILLRNLNLLTNFANYCEEHLKTITTEIASINARVGDGFSEASMLATVKKNIKEGDETDNITAAIFARANREGSEIVLNADKITLSAEHRIDLSTGTFTLNSDSISIDESGQTVINGDLYAKTLNTTSGKTMIDEDGVLHAIGVDISGTVIASEFRSERNGVEFEASDGSLWSFDKESIMDADSFQISTMATHNDEIQNSSIYISVIPEMEITDTSSPLYSKATTYNGKKYLYAIPTLCFNYGGESYYLTPGSWVSGGISGGDTSMYFKKQYEEIYTGLSLRGSPSNSGWNYIETVKTGTEVDSPVHYYIFSTKNIDDILYRPTEKLREFKYDFGTIANTESYQSILSTYGLDKPNLYAHSVPSDYIYSSVGKIAINQTNAQAFSRLLLNGYIYKKTYDTSIKLAGSSTPQITLNNTVIRHLISKFNNPYGWTFAEGISSECHGGILNIFEHINPFGSILTENVNFDNSEIRKTFKYVYNQKYINGECLLTTDVNTSYAESEYKISVRFSQEDTYKVNIIDPVGNSSYVYISNIEFIASYGIYSQTITIDDNLKDTLKNILDTSTFNDIDKCVNVKINVYVSTESMIQFDKRLLAFRT